MQNTITTETSKPKPKIEINDQFKKAFALIEDESRHVYITGKAGTGKSTFLNFLRKNTRKNLVVLASTGVAAVNVRGQTIYSFFRFKPDITVDAVSEIKFRGAKRKKMYKSLDVIVIDEISMVRADLLDCINAFLKIYGPDPELDFGGVQMIFIGDLFQLSPVVRR